jgi:hypothetical protein
MMIAPGRGWWFGGGNTRWLAVDLTRPERPVIAGDYSLGDRGSVSAISVRGGKVFASSARYEWVPAVTNKPAGSTTLPWWELQGSWVTEHALHVLDAADAAEPVLRDPVMLPGELKGVSHGGSVLYCRVESNSAKGLTSVALQALGYDGIKARRIAERELPDLGAYPVAVLGDGRIAVGFEQGMTLETWALDDGGTLKPVAPAVKLGFTVNRFLEFDGVLLGEGDGSLVLVDTLANPLRVQARGERPCSLWLDRGTLAVPTPAGVWVARGVSGAWWLPFRNP